jgi:hypothetical protein
VQLVPREMLIPRSSLEFLRCYLLWEIINRTKIWKRRSLLHKWAWIHSPDFTVN